MSDTTSTTASDQRHETFENDGRDRHSLQAYVSDLIALVKHIEVPVERQLRLEESANYADATAIMRDIASVTAAQRVALEAELERLGGHGATGIKSAWSAMLGVGAAAVGSVRSTKVSKSLRDDYTALSLASISYTMLNATALGFGDEALAALAARHLEGCAALIIRISTAIPAIVLAELRDDGEAVVVSAAEASARDTHAAWRTN